MDFKLGFLYGLASKGITPEELGNALVKSSFDVSSLFSGGGKLLDIGTAAAVGAPLALGVGGGALAYGMTRPDYNANIEDMQRQQVLNELRKYTRDAKRRTSISPAAAPTTASNISAGY